MAGKSRRKRAKQTQRRQIDVRQRPATATQMPVTPKPGESVAQPEASSPPVTVSRQATTNQTIRHPYIASELRTIGILAGIMVIILVISYFALP